MHSKTAQQAFLTIHQAEFGQTPLLPNESVATEYWEIFEEFFHNISDLREIRNMVRAMGDGHKFRGPPKLSEWREFLSRRKQEHFELHEKADWEVIAEKIEVMIQNGELVNPGPCEKCASKRVYVYPAHGDLRDGKWNCSNLLCILNKLKQKPEIAVNVPGTPVSASGDLLPPGDELDDDEPDDTPIDELEGIGGSSTKSGIYIGPDGKIPFSERG